MCYFPAGHFYLLLTVCDVTCGPATALNATRRVVSPTYFLFSFSLISFSLSAAARCWYELSDQGQQFCMPVEDAGAFIYGT